MTDDERDRAIPADIRGAAEIEERSSGVTGCQSSVTGGKRND